MAVPVTIYHCIFACQLKRSLIGLAAAVGHKNLVHAGGLCQSPGRLCERFRIEIIGEMDPLVNLSLQCLFVFPVTVPQRTNGDAASKIQIFFSFHIIEIHVLTMIQHNRIPVIGMDQILFCLLYFFLHDSHFSFSCG